MRSEVQTLIKEFTDIVENWDKNDVIVNDKIVTQVINHRYYRTHLLAGEMLIFETRADAEAFVEDFDIPGHLYTMWTRNPQASNGTESYNKAHGFVYLTNNETDRFSGPVGVYLEEKHLPTPFYDYTGQRTLTYDSFTKIRGKERKTPKNKIIIPPGTESPNLLKRNDETYYNQSLPHMTYNVCELPDILYNRFITVSRPLPGRERLFTSDTNREVFNVDDLWTGNLFSPQHNYYTLCGRATSLQKFNAESEMIESGHPDQMIAQTALWTYIPSVMANYNSTSPVVGRKGASPFITASTNISLLAYVIGNAKLFDPQASPAHTLFWEPALNISMEGYEPPRDGLATMGTYFKPIYGGMHHHIYRRFQFSVPTHELPPFNYKWGGLLAVDINVHDGATRDAFYGAVGGHGCVILEMNYNILVRWSEDQMKEKNK